jgi:hypothetical protein
MKTEDSKFSAAPLRVRRPNIHFETTPYDGRRVLQLQVFCSQLLNIQNQQERGGLL